MIWQYLLTALSAILFFGFVGLCFHKFGIQTCYSAYGPLWASKVGSTHVRNPWCYVTFISAAMLIPVLVVAGEGNDWQFAGFLCPVLIMLVASTPDYKTDVFVGRLHSICAIGGALWAILFIIFVAPKFFPLLIVYAILAGIFTLALGVKNWNLWYELAAYLSIYTTVFAII